MVRFFTFLIFMCLSSVSWAAPSIIRDAEIENSLRIFSRPIFNQAGLAVENVRFVIVNSPELNAFVAGGQNIFFYTGLLLETEDVGELIGVTAHETSHITSGHMTRTNAVLEQASFQTILTTIIGVAAALGTGNAGIGNAIAIGGVGFAQQTFLGHSRIQESAADQGGIGFLKHARLSPKGFLNFMKKLESQELLPASQQSAYLRTHPLTRDRVLFLERIVKKSPHSDKPFPKDWEERHRRMKAKLTGFLFPERALRLKDDGSIATRYARAIAYYRKDKTKQALALIDALLMREPDNPYFHELKGQILFETGKIQDSVLVYKQSVALLPSSGLLQTSLAHALLEANSKSTTYAQEAVKHLTYAKKSEFKSPHLHRLLATAYGRLGQKGLARLHLAEEAFLQNRLEDSKRQVQYAQNTLSKDSTGWLRAQDLLSFIKARQKK